MEGTHAAGVQSDVINHPVHQMADAADKINAPE